MRRKPDDRTGTENAPRNARREVVLAKMHDVGTSRIGDVCPIVDRQQRAVCLACFPEHLEKAQFLTGFEAFLPQLNYVDAGAEHVVEEPRQVALPLACVSAQV